MSDPAGNALDWSLAGGSALVSLYEGVDRKPTEVHLGLEELGMPRVHRSLAFQIVPGEILVSSKLGDRFVAPATVSVVPNDGSLSCHADQQQSVGIEVVDAFAYVDVLGKTIDRDFRRRFIVDIDWANVGCGIGTVRGRWTLEVTASVIVINCEDTFRVVGIREPFSPRKERLPAETRARDRRTRRSFA